MSGPFGVKRLDITRRVRHLNAFGESPEGSLSLIESYEVGYSRKRSDISDLAGLEVGLCDEKHSFH
jgi:hypothetical protein